MSKIETHSISISNIHPGNKLKAIKKSYTTKFRKCQTNYYTLNYCILFTKFLVLVQFCLF